MLILSLDSAAAGCSACVWRDGAVLSVRAELMARGQDGRLVPLVQDVMAEAGVSFADLDRIVATRGPGSFTGLRIGLATARGLGLAAEKPVVGISRLEIYKAQNGMRPLLVALDSRRSELFTAFYEKADSDPAPCLLEPEQVSALADAFPALSLAGDAADQLRAFGRPLPFSFLPLTEPEVVTAAALGAVADLENPAYHPGPLYLRAPDVTCPKRI